MTKSKLLTQIALSGFCALVLLLGVGSDAWARPTGMLQAYGSAVAFGEYEGTLYCLRHDFSQTRKTTRYAPKRDGIAMSW